jgi:hypothetical protein
MKPALISILAFIFILTGVALFVPTGCAPTPQPAPASQPTSQPAVLTPTQQFVDGVQTFITAYQVAKIFDPSLDNPAFDADIKKGEAIIVAYNSVPPGTPMAQADYDFLTTLQAELAQTSASAKYTVTLHRK